MEICVYILAQWFAIMMWCLYLHHLDGRNRSILIDILVAVIAGLAVEVIKTAAQIASTSPPMYLI